MGFTFKVVGAPMGSTFRIVGTFRMGFTFKIVGATMGFTLRIVGGTIKGFTFNIVGATMDFTFQLVGATIKGFSFKIVRDTHGFHLSNSRGHDQGRLVLPAIGRLKGSQGSFLIVAPLDQAPPWTRLPKQSALGFGGLASV